MFTGIIEAIGTIKTKSGGRLVITRPASFKDLKLGSSVSISGVCLSVVMLTKNEMAFDVVPETFAKTKLGKLKEADGVNLERALEKGGRFDGHMVQGHVEDVGSVTAIKKEKSGVRMTINIPANLSAAVIPKGSITIDGVSLTVAAIKNNRCEIALIPHTLKHTTLGLLKKGDLVNLETDVIIRALLHHHLLPLKKKRL